MGYVMQRRRPREAKGVGYQGMREVMRAVEFFRCGKSQPLSRNELSGLLFVVSVGSRTIRKDRDREAGALLYENVTEAVDAQSKPPIGNEEADQPAARKTTDVEILVG